MTSEIMKTKQKITANTERAVREDGLICEVTDVLPKWTNKPIAKTSITLAVEIYE